MPRPLRRDGTDTWHHVWSRSVAQRPIFEDRRDMRFFLSQVAWMVHAGLLEVHAYSVLITHFHLLVRCPGGGLSLALKWIKAQFARYFNRTRERDGPVFRGRFGSREIHSSVYWEAVLRYIDYNAIGAELAEKPGDYRWCSAWYHVGRRGAPWLSRRIVSAIIGSQTAVIGGKPDYARVYDWRGKPFFRRLVEDRMDDRPGGPDPLDDLIGATADRTRRWLEERARCADGAIRPRLIVAAETVAAAIESFPGETFVRPVSGSRSIWRLTLSAGLYRTVCGVTMAETGIRINRSTSTVSALIAEHDRLLVTDARYAEIAAEILRASLEKDVGRPMGEEILRAELGRSAPRSASGEKVCLAPNA